MINKKRLNINQVTFFNILSTFLLQGIAFLTIPLFTRMLGTEQYGLYSVYISWVSLIACFMGLNVSSSLGTGLFHFKENYHSFRSSVLVLGTFISIAIILIGVALIKPLSSFMNYSGLIYILLLVTSFGHFVITFVQLSFIYEKKAISNLIFSLILSLSTVGLSVLLILFSKNNSKYVGRILGYSIPYIFIAALMWIIFFFKKPTFIKKEYAKYALLFGIPIVFHSLSQNVLAQSDRVMMQNLGVLDSDIGVYSLYYSFTGVMSTLLIALNNSWCPFFYEFLKKEDWDGLDKKIKNYTEFFTILMVGFLLLSREVSFLFANSDFWIGVDLIPIITISYLFMFLYMFPVNYELFHKKTTVIAIGTMCAALANIGLNFALIPLWGMYGAAIATAISYLFLFVIHLFIVGISKMGHYKINFLYFIPCIISVIIACCLFYLFKDFVKIRWLLGAFLGIFEITRIWKRKTIF